MTARNLLMTALLLSLSSLSSALEPFLYLRDNRVYLREGSKDSPLTPTPSKGGEIYLFQASPDGRAFMVKMKDSREIKFYDFAGKELGQLVGANGWPGDVVWSPDGGKALLINGTSYGRTDVPSSGGNTTQEIAWIDLRSKERGNYAVDVGYKLVSRDPQRYLYTSNKPYGLFLAWAPDSNALWFRHPNDPSSAFSVRLGKDAPEHSIGLPEPMRWNEQGLEQNCRPLDAEQRFAALWREGTAPLKVPNVADARYNHFACSRSLRAFAMIHAGAKGIKDDRWRLSLFEISATGVRLTRTLDIGVPLGMRYLGEDLLLDDGHGIQSLSPDGKRRTVARAGSLQLLPLRGPYPRR